MKMSKKLSPGATFMANMQLFKICKMIINNLQLFIHYRTLRQIVRYCLVTSYVFFWLYPFGINRDLAYSAQIPSTGNTSFSTVSPQKKVNSVKANPTNLSGKVLHNSYKGLINLEVVRLIESQGCKAPCVGDGGKALGPYQLHRGVVADYNRHHNTSYLHQDALGAKASVIASWYLSQEIPRLLKHYKKPVTLENVLTAWNKGILAVIQKRPATAYIAKYRRLSHV